jgi:hypothetical protein
MELSRQMKVTSEAGENMDLLRSDRRPLRSPEESKKEEVGIKKFGERKK